MTTHRLCHAAILWGCLILAAGWGEAKPRIPLSAAQVRPSPTRAVIAPEQIREAITRDLKQRFAGKVQDLDIALLEPHEPVAVEPGTPELTVLPDESGNPVGRRWMRVQIRVHGREVGRVEALVEIVAYADVIVAQRLLKPDEPIGPDDVAVARVKLADPAAQFARQMNDVVGKVAARPIPAQRPMRLSDVKLPNVVRKGDRVVIEAQGQGLLIRTVGVSKSGGQVGQYVTVSNVDSGRDIKAQVVAPGVVRVDY